MSSRCLYPDARVHIRVVGVVCSLLAALGRVLVLGWLGTWALEHVMLFARREMAFARLEGACATSSVLARPRACLRDLERACATSSVLARLMVLERLMVFGRLPAFARREMRTSAPKCAIDGRMFSSRELWSGFVDRPAIRSREFEMVPRPAFPTKGSRLRKWGEAGMREAKSRRRGSTQVRQKRSPAGEGRVRQVRAKSRRRVADRAEAASGRRGPTRAQRSQDPQCLSWSGRTNSSSGSVPSDGAGFGTKSASW